jgi:transposase
MGLSSYSIMMKSTPQAQLFQFKKQVVQWTQVHGIKPAVRKWGLGRNTIRRWQRRFEQEGNQGLHDKRKGPKHIPHKTPLSVQQQVISAREQAPCYGARRLKYFFELPCSAGAIFRILKQHGLVRRQKKKHQIKNDLREAKAKYKAFGHLQMDVKYLRDIPNYWGQKKEFKLPGFEYTVRDTKSGMLFLGFSDELSELTARTMVDYILARLRAQMPDKEIIIQTDNGVEFSGTTRYFEKATFSQRVARYGAKHVFIPPKMCNAKECVA